MAYLLQTFPTKDSAIDIAEKPFPFGASLKDKQVLDRIVRGELWVSSFHDPGPDWNLFQFFDIENNLVWEHKFDGY